MIKRNKTVTFWGVVAGLIDVAPWDATGYAPAKSNAILKAKLSW